MVFSMHYLPKMLSRFLIQWLGVICLYVLAVFTPNFAEIPPKIALESVTLAADAPKISLNLKRSIHLSTNLEKILVTGVPLFLTDEVEVYRWRWYWSDKKLFTRKRTWVIYKHSLTEQWLVINTQQKVIPVGSLAEAIQLVTTSTNWVLDDDSSLLEGNKYYLRIRTYIDTDRMSPALRLDTINNNDWTLSSEWFTIENAQKNSSQER